MKTDSNSFALITGASQGIGLELARVFAQHKINLILSSRREKELTQLAEELSSKYLVRVYIKSADLSIPDEVVGLHNFIREKKFFIEYLVNNAGFGWLGKFHDSDWKNMSDMIQLNMHAPVYLTREFVNDMIANKRGRILNIVSTAAFQPGPLMTLYYATKAFVLSFSEGISEELNGTGVTVTALCPGPTYSGFQKKAEIGNARILRTIPVATSEKVALFGYKAMMKGKSVAIPGFMNSIGVFSVRLTPRSVARKLVKRLHLPLRK